MSVTLSGVKRLPPSLFFVCFHSVRPVGLIPHSSVPQLALNAKEEEIRSLKARVTSLAREKAAIAAGAQQAAVKRMPKSRAQALVATTKVSLGCWTDVPPVLTTASALPYGRTTLDLPSRYVHSLHLPRVPPSPAARSGMRTSAPRAPGRAPRLSASWQW